MAHERNTTWSTPTGGRNDISANALTDPATDRVIYSGNLADGRSYTATMSRDALAAALDESGAPWRLPHGAGGGWRVGPFELDVVQHRINGLNVDMSVIFN